MKLTITAYGDTQVDAATNAFLALGQLLQGFATGEDKNDIGSYTYELEGEGSLVEGDDT